MFVPTDITYNAEDFAGYTLVVPAVAVGHVGQLAVDVLIATLRMHPVGRLHHDSFLPVVGYDPFNEDSAAVMTAAEVYVCEDRRVLALQQRALLARGRHPDYAEALLGWIQDARFAHVIILTATFSHERRDGQLQGSQLRYVSSDAACAPPSDCGLSPLEGCLEEGDGLSIPGGGISSLLYRRCVAVGVACCILLRFCAEGDNTGDALQLITALAAWQKWQEGDAEAEWQVPLSWKLLYGNRVNPILFR